MSINNLPEEWREALKNKGPKQERIIFKEPSFEMSSPPEKMPLPGGTTKEELMQNLSELDRERVNDFLKKTHSSHRGTNSFHKHMDIDKKALMLLNKYKKEEKMDDINTIKRYSVRLLHDDGRMELVSNCDILPEANYVLQLKNHEKIVPYKGTYIIQEVYEIQ